MDTGTLKNRFPQEHQCEDCKKMVHADDAKLVFHEPNPGYRCLECYKKIVKWREANV